MGKITHEEKMALLDLIVTYAAWASESAFREFGTQFQVDAEARAYHYFREIELKLNEFMGDECEN